MGGYKKHLSDRKVIYPIASIFSGGVSYGFTHSSLLMMWTIIVGYVFLILGLLIPDVDSTQSVIHQALNRFLTGAIVLLIIYWILISDIGASYGLLLDADIIFQPVPNNLILVLLIALFVVWVGYTDTHRGRPHQIGWAIVMASVIIFGVWFSFEGWPSLDRLGVGIGIAVHFLAGVGAHLDRDGIIFGEDASYRR